VRFGKQPFDARPRMPLLLILVCANPFSAAAAEARSILGVDVGVAVSSDDGLMRDCIYSSADTRNQRMLEAKTADKVLFERRMKLRENFVPKLGGDAYTNSGVLLVWKNGTQVNVKISDESGESSDEQIEVAPEKVADLVLRNG
jgi:hypothetical protein